MKSPSQLTVVELKKALSSAGVTGLSGLKRDQLVRKYRYNMGKKRSKSPKRKSPKKSPKRKSPKKSPKRGPRPACLDGKKRRTPSSRCVVEGSNAWKTVAELKDEAKTLGLKNLSGKTKAQLIAAIKRELRCPSPKVYDARTKACRDKKERVYLSKEERLAQNEMKKIASAQAQIKRARDKIGELRSSASKKSTRSSSSTLAEAGLQAQADIQRRAQARANEIDNRNAFRQLPRGSSARYNNY
jgi:hypothetical protein